MKAITSCFVLLLLISTLLSSCRTVYAPNALNVPLLQEKGEVKATIATNNLQVAVALSDHIGVMANGYLNAYKSDDKSFKNNGQGAEIGAGYFAQTAHRIVYEAYGGVGLYNVKIKEGNSSKTFDANAIKYFVQPAVGWLNQYFEIAVSPRLSVVKYGSPTITGYTSDEQSANYFNILDQKAHAFLEPTLILRGGYKFVKVQAQYGHSFKISKNNINYDDNIGSIGLIFDIAGWYKKNR